MRIEFLAVALTLTACTPTLKGSEPEVDPGIPTPSNSPKSPRSEGPRNDGPRSEGPRNDGPGTDAATNAPPALDAYPAADRAPAPRDAAPPRDSAAPVDVFRGSPPDSRPDDGAGQAKIRLAVAKVFDTTILHRIDIQIPVEHVATVESRSSTRVPCTFTFDGVTLTNVGIRQAGGAFNPYKKINDKPSFSLKFDEFVKGQDLHGIEKFTLKNMLQDESMANEHMTYEVYRRAGLPSRVTAHALVTVNGLASGIYLMREGVNQPYLVGLLGKGYEQGNLYEGDWTIGDFVGNASKLILDDEKEEGRSRADINAFASALRAATAQTFEAEVSKHIDLGHYITHLAVTGVASNLDSFDFNNNNYYLYANPRDGRFLLIPQGADQAFWGGTLRLKSALDLPKSTLGKKLRSVPGLEARLIAEVARVGSPPVWDVNVLLARLAQLGDLLKTAPRMGKANADINAFEKRRPTLEAFIRAGGLSKGADGLPPPP